MQATYRLVTPSKRNGIVYNDISCLPSVECVMSMYQVGCVLEYNSKALPVWEAIKIAERGAEARKYDEQCTVTTNGVIR